MSGVLFTVVLLLWGLTSFEACEEEGTSDGEG